MKGLMRAMVIAFALSVGIAKNLWAQESEGDRVPPFTGMIWHWSNPLDCSFNTQYMTGTPSGVVTAEDVATGDKYNTDVVLNEDDFWYYTFGYRLTVGHTYKLYGIAGGRSLCGRTVYYYYGFSGADLKMYEIIGK